VVRSWAGGGKAGCDEVPLLLHSTTIMHGELSQTAGQGSSGGLKEKHVPTNQPATGQS
jgi:hypothetical protein